MKTTLFASLFALSVALIVPVPVTAAGPDPVSLADEVKHVGPFPTKAAALRKCEELSANHWCHTYQQGGSWWVMYRRK